MLINRDPIVRVRLVAPHSLSDDCNESVVKAQRLRAECDAVGGGSARDSWGQADIRDDRRSVERACNGLVRLVQHLLALSQRWRCSDIDAAKDKTLC
jgi:hypothetical protein